MISNNELSRLQFHFLTRKLEVCVSIGEGDIFPFEESLDLYSMLDPVPWGEWSLHIKSIGPFLYIVMFCWVGCDKSAWARDFDCPLGSAVLRIGMLFSSCLTTCPGIWRDQCVNPARNGCLRMPIQSCFVCVPDGKWVNDGWLILSTLNSIAYLAVLLGLWLRIMSLSTSSL